MNNRRIRKDMLALLRDVVPNEGKRLKLLNLFLRDDLALAHEQVQDRMAYLRSIHLLQEKGFIAVVSGGRDCDMSEWHGVVRIVHATPDCIKARVLELYDSAEGPVWWNLEKPSVARGIRRTSRDLALEAFEDGHAHCVSTARFDEGGDYVH